MFWNYMNMVHEMPTFEERNEKPWHTPEEKKKLELVEYQLSYGRPFEEGAMMLYPVHTEPRDEDCSLGSCLAPSEVFQDGEWVLGLSPGYIGFFEEHLGVGKYIGAVTYEGVEEPVYMCPDCMRKDPRFEGKDDREIYNEFFEGQDLDEDDLGLVCDVDGLGKRIEVEGRPELDDAWEFTCPHCGGKAKRACYEEGPDVDTLWVFEEGSIAFSHYGRGAGLSFRLHKNLSFYKGEKGKDLLALFKGLAD